MIDKQYPDDMTFEDIGDAIVDESIARRINSRQKGAVGEREWARIIRKIWNAVTARRGCQYAGGPDSPDVTGIPGLHCEVKRTEKLSVYKAMSQAIKDSGKNTPYVAHRKNCEDWLIIIRADDVLAFVKAINEL